MPQPLDSVARSGAARPEIGRRIATNLLVRILLLGLGAWVAWQAFATLLAYREFRTLAHELPDLPQVRGVPLPRDPKFPVKVWLHRVNSIPRARRMARQFQGMEIDVMYDAATDVFDIGHPPEPSIGLSLDSLLAAVPDVGHHYFWIDFRNLSDANASAACTRLTAIAAKYGLVSHMIVESIRPAALACFGDHGFYTSYYLFPEFSLPAMSTAQRAAYYEEVKAGLAASSVTAVSMSYENLPFVDRYFPDADVLLWYREPSRNLRYYATLAYLKARRHVQVVLIRQMSR
jgi:heptose-I-phosphate ethanolaminephosphotransferase